MDILSYLRFDKTKSNRFSGIKDDDILFLKPSLSSGLNWLDPPSMYTKYYLEEVKKNHFIKNYSINSGYPILLDVIRYYENFKFTGSIESNENDMDICITAGGTSAIAFLFNYLCAQNTTAKFLFVGLSYYVFYFCIERLHLEHYTLVSGQKNRILPNLDEIIYYLDNNKVDYIVLTSPQNPSGEIYDEIEFTSLVKEMKKRNIKLVLDVCQMDEFNHIDTYVNFNRIASTLEFSNEMLIINSLSKTRSIPGARIGYIVGGKEVIDYISSQNEYYYSNHPLIYITPIVMDMLFKIIKLKSSTGLLVDFKVDIKIFKQKIIGKLGLELYHSLFKNVFSNIEEEYHIFGEEISQQYSIFKSNMNYLLDKLHHFIDAFTPLQGGFNFCIKLKNTKSKFQMEYTELMSKSIMSLLLPESSFNGFIVNANDDPFWIRITVALQKDIFEDIVDRMYSFLHFEEKGGNNEYI